jgi:hypothetical protein
LKATNTTSSAVHAEKAKNAGKRAQKKGSRVTEARAKAQRAKLDTQAEARHGQEEQEAIVHTTQNKQTVRQEMQAKRRVISVLIEAYIQDHIAHGMRNEIIEELMLI